ncbi:unnamed protein product [Dracunculus medinensis]|uniref:LEM domain-containing protein n=1 Tax=Dracunculus medinensis TaxID=318479 RepID=A0A0N4U5S5_DRAME|nr:unnamed protein product [Dracunculus medinensis]
MNIDELSDNEIRQKLLERGINTGPIVATTRNVYANKLQKLIEDSTSSANEKVEQVRSIFYNFFLSH